MAAKGKGKKKEPGRKLDRREEILEVASRCIVKYGLQRTTAQLIADEMGVSQTKIFYHFQKQHMLFDALIDHAVQQGRDYSQKLMANSSSGDNYKKRLEHYILGQLSWTEALPHHICVLLFSILESPHNTQLQTKMQAIFKNGEEQVFSCLAGGLVQKEFRLIIDPRTAAVLIHKTLMGVVLEQYQRSGSQSVQASFLILKQLLSLILLDP